MDWTSLISSVISAFVAIAICVINGNAQLKKADIEQDKRMIEMRSAFENSSKMTNYQIEQLTSEVREHNNFARRMPVVENEIATINKRLDALERRGA